MCSQYIYTYVLYSVCKSCRVAVLTSFAWIRDLNNFVSDMELGVELSDVLYTTKSERACALEEDTVIFHVMEIVLPLRVFTVNVAGEWSKRI